MCKGPCSFHGAAGKEWMGGEQQGPLGWELSATSGAFLVPRWGLLSLPQLLPHCRGL